MARPAGVVRSTASVSETKPTPRGSSSCSVANRSATDRPQRSNRHTSTTSISRRRAASSNFSRSCRCDATAPDLFHLQGESPTPPDDVFPQGADLQGDGLLVVRRDAGVDAGAEHFRWFPCLAKNPRRFRRNVVKAFQCRNRYVIALPKPELGSVFRSANCASSQPCSFSIAGPLCS